MKTYLITGGLGFIGSNYIKSIIKNKINFVINLDIVSYASNEDRFCGYKNYKFFKGDVCDKKLVTSIFEDFNIDYVINFAAESHVDNSLVDVMKFVNSNVLGVANLLDCAQKSWKNKKNKRFIQISTDEVYGSNKDKEFFEDDKLSPSSPYSSTKACAELICKSYVSSFNFPAIIVRSSNNFGFYQHPEKLVPKTFLSCVNKKPILLYKNSKFHKRNWLYVEDNVNAINLVLEKGKIGEVYNICSDTEKTNIEIIKKIIDYCKNNIDNKISEKLIKIVNTRPNDDERYLMNCDKITKLGFVVTNFEENFKSTLDFYKNNIEYLKKQSERNYNKNKK